MIECYVIRNKEGEIDKVLAPNGSDSLLYQTILKSIPDKQAALREWAIAYTPAFKQEFGDWETYFYSEAGGGGKFTSTTEAPVNKSNVNKKSMLKAPDGKYYFVNDMRIREMTGEDYLALSEDGIEEGAEEEYYSKAPMQYDLGPVNIRKDNIFEDVSEKESPLFVPSINDLKGWTVVGTYKFDKDLYRTTTAKLFRGKLDENGEPFYEYIRQEKLLLGPSTNLNDRKELLKEAKELSSGIKGLYKGIFINDPEQGLFEAAVQYNTGGKDQEEALKVFGYDIMAIAIKMFPDAKVGDKFNRTIEDDNIYKQVVSSNVSQSLLGSLQSKKQLGKRIGYLSFEAPIDPTDYNLADQQQRTYEIAQKINADSGKELVYTFTLPDGSMGIQINADVEAIVKNLDPSDIDSYKKFLMENLYTNNTNPTTTELINNAGKLAKDLGRQDLVNMARLIYKYLPKNQSLSTRIIDVMPQEVGGSKTKAYYHRTSNRITFARNTIGINTMEFEAVSVLHEHLHGLTFQPWFKQEQKIPLNADERIFKGVVEGYYNYFKSLQGAAVKNHGFLDPEEFLMASLTDSQFKNHLRNISQNDKIKENPFISFMKDLLKGFLRLFGIKIDNKVVDQIDPSKFEGDMFDALSTYLDKIDRISLFNGLKEDGRNYGLSFALTAEGDYETEREKAKQKFTPELKEQVKKVIEKSILSIKSFGSTIRTRLPETQEGFQAIFRQLKKLEDPDYNLDQIDFFFDFSSEISAIMNMADAKITKLQLDQTLNDPDFKLKEYESIVYAIRNFDSIISDIQGVKVRMENSGMGDAVKELNNIFEKRARIEAIYSMGVFPLVTSKLVDILEPGSKKAIEIASNNIDRLKQSLALATKNNVTARIKQLEKQLKVEQSTIDKQFTLNSEKVESWLRGEMGDSNIYTTYLRAGVSNSNPIVSSLSKFIRDNVGEIAPKVLELQNALQNQIEEYNKNSGRNKNSTTEFNQPLVQTHKEITGKDDKGNYTYKDVLSLLNPFNGAHIVELQTFKRNLTDLYARKRELEDSPTMDKDKHDQVLKEINEAKKARQNFLKDYMEQKYAPEVHAALDMLYDDLGGYNAWDYMGPVLSRIEDLQTAIDQQTDEARISDLYNQLDDQNFELTRLSSLYEKSPDSREFKVAEQLKKRSELLRQYSTFVLTDKGHQHFLAEKSRIHRKLDAKEITPQRYERWLEDNTITELSPKYWEDKKTILDGIHDVAARLGAISNDNKELKTLYKDIEDIVKVYRNKEGIINGQEMSDKELKDVKEVEEKIEFIKENIENILGLTKLERVELSNLYNQLREITDKIIFSSSPVEGSMLDQEQDRVNARITEISNKKKKLDPALMKEYFEWIKKLSELDESKETKYYLDEVAEQIEKAKWAIDISKIPSKFFVDGKTYQKNGNDWFEINGSKSVPRDNSFVEDVYRKKQGEANLAASEWWKNNHLTVIQYTPNDDYDASNPNSSSGEWGYVEKPIFAWRQTRPKDPRYISNDQPSIKYKKREIKEQYVNKNYREDVSGNIQPKVNGAKDDRFVNKDYKKLANSGNSIDQATFKYLSYLSDTYLKAQESIPMPRRKGYELPSIRKSTVERLFSQPINTSTQETFGRLGNMLRLWNDDVATNEQDKDILFGYNDDFTGIVPMKFLGDIDSKDQSIDLAKSILAFTIESMKRDQLIKSLPFVNAIKDIVNNPDYKPVKTKDGKIQTSKRKFLPKGTELAKRGEISATALQVNEIIKSEIYGENMKEIAGAKFVNSTLGMGAKLMLGLNFVSSIQNYANAFTQSIMETESKISGNFTMANFFKAQKIYYGHTTSLMADLGKYGNKSYMNQFFDYFGGINFKLYSKNDRNLANGKLREFLGDLSVPNTITEHMLNYHMGIAIALNYRVKAIVNGTETNVPIFEAFTLKDRNLEIKPGVTVTEADRKEMISRLNTSARRINGEYGDKILSEKFILGKLFLFMNRYVIPFVVKRYGVRKYDIQDGVTEEGYWRLFGKTLLKDIKSKSIPIISGWKYYTKEEKTAIVRAMTEFGFSVAFFLILNALGAGGDDKHLKDNSLLTNNLIYALKGIQQQNESFMPVPGVGFDDLLRKIQNPFPILGKVKNLVAIIQDGSHTLYYEMGLPGVDKSDVIFSKESGWHKPGDFKVMADLQKLLGLPQHLMQYMYPDQAVKNLDAFSRIK